MNHTKRQKEVKLPLSIFRRSVKKIGKGGPSSPETVNIINWLIGEELIKWHASGGIIGLTRRRITEVEDGRTNTNLPTEHFSPDFINNVINNYGTCIIWPYNNELAILISQLRILNSIMKALLKLSTI
jgi:hypothetical protein